MKRLLCIRLPSWPIQRLVVAQPALSHRVIILHARDPRRGQCVVACSRAAHGLGVRLHMPLAEASSLVPTDQAPHTPPATPPPAAASGAAASGAGSPMSDARPLAATTHAAYIAEHDPEADRAALEQLAQWCERFSPLVGFEDLTPLHAGNTGQAEPPQRSDCLYLEVTHLDSYFGSEQQLARLVAESLSRWGYVARVAVADTLGATWALTHFATAEATFVPSPDNLPTDSSDPSASCSFLVVPPGDTCAALLPLPVAALRLPAATLSLLQQLGIERLEQLACLPRDGLLSRFGDLLLRRWDQASGRVDEVLLVHHAAPQFHVHWQLEHPTANQAALRTILSQLLERLTATLRERGEGVIQCLCRLLLAGSPSIAPIPLTLRIGLYRPTATVAHLQQLIHMQMERLQLPGPVSQLTLEASITAPLERRQRELFSDATRPATWQLAQLLDRLSSRLGPANVVEARLQRDAQPEYGYRYLPLTGRRRPPQRTRSRRAAQAPTVQAPTVRRSRRTHARRAQSTRPQHGPAVPLLAAAPLPPSSAALRHVIRPLHLRSPPLPLAVVAVAPDGPLAQFMLANQVHRVVRCWGPERIETGWWRGPSVRRDYYRLETQRGHWLWVFRQHRDGNWFLHGMFG